MTYLSQELGAYVAQLCYEDLPSQAIVAAKKCILDGVANMFCGRHTHTGEQILTYLEQYPLEGALPKVTLIGCEDTALEQVLLAHTVMARCADLDDGSRRAMGHPGCVLVPVALAVGQAYQKSGRDLLCALVAGYDIYVRVGGAINPTSYRDRGFDATGLCGAVAAAAVASKLMDGTAGQVKDALGLAALFCGGLIEYQNDGTMGKTLCGAWAAQTGLRAARLAHTGFTGPDAALEGKKAFMQAFSNAPCGEQVVAGLGTDFCITEVYFKLHACMRGLHSAIDATLQLREEWDLRPETVKSMTVWTTPFVQRLSNPTPETAVGAQCSLQFTMATALKHGHLMEEKLLVASLDDKEILELSGKIQCCLSQEMEQYVAEHPTHWSAVCIEAKKLDGSRQKQTVYLPSGEPERPLSWERLVDKLLLMTAGSPLEALARELPARILTLENQDDLSQLLK